MIYWVTKIDSEPEDYDKLEVWELLDKLKNIPYKDGVRYWIETRRGNE